MNPLILSIFLFIFFAKNSSSDPIVSAIEDNWNQIKSMSGQFEQIDQEGNIFGGQFNPQKSVKSGLKIINNFISLKY